MCVNSVSSSGAAAQSELYTCGPADATELNFCSYFCLASATKSCLGWNGPHTVDLELAKLPASTSVELGLLAQAAYPILNIRFTGIKFFLNQHHSLDLGKICFLSFKYFTPFCTALVPCP